MKTLAKAAALFLPLAAVVPAKAQDAAATLPGGANALQETYQDWRVACSVVQGGKICSMSQLQTQQNGQRVMAIELQLAKGNSVNGVVALPFGLKLEAGAGLQIDDSPALPQLRFSTCLPVGCLVPVTFSADNLTALKSGTALKVSAMPIDNSQPLALSVSLKGFAAALDRLAELQKS